jgi:hypothetical protein
MIAKTRASNDPSLVQVTLKKPHTHAGVQYQADDKIKITEAEKEWLTKAGVIGSKANTEAELTPDNGTGAQSNG